MPVFCSALLKIDATLLSEKVLIELMFITCWKAF
jgi:hypothetical protein